MLSEKHRDELRASGISDLLSDATGIRSVTDREARELLKWKPNSNSRHQSMAGWAIPFRADGEAGASYYRVKPDTPRINGEGRLIKYESPRGKSNSAYFPPGFWEVLPATHMILVTEGEKKSLSAASHGFACIGLVGVWGWQRKRKRTDAGRKYGRRELIAELAGIDWKGRQVVIVFDSDAATNDLVLLAEYKLTEALQAVGATVRIVRLPSLDDAKTGLDDFLVARGAEELQKLIDAAEQAEEPPAMDCMSLAKLYLEDQHTTPSGPSLRWHRDEFWKWNGRSYARLPDSELRMAMILWADRHFGGAKPRMVVDAMACLAAIVRVPFDVEQPTWLGNGPKATHDLIAMQNGIVDLGAFLSHGEVYVRQHSAQFFTSIALPYCYDTDAKSDIWFKTLDGIFDGDSDRIDLLGEWFGYCLTDDTAQQAILICEGPRRSGKGVVLRMLEAVVGKQNCTSPRLAGLGDTFGLWGLIGKRVAICPDAHLGHGHRAMAVLEILKLISGEDSIEIQRKNLPPITTRLRVKVALAVNELPKFGDSSGALASRALILPFRKSFAGHEDRKLESKLAQEVPGVFNWALEGLRRLNRAGQFTHPKISSEVEQDFELLTSPLRAFLEDCCTMRVDSQVSRDDLWRAWCRWTEDNRHVSGSRELLGSRLRAIVPGLRTSQPRLHGGKRTRVYVGLELRP